MMISTKGRYALQVMVDLAQHNTGEFIPVKEIAARQDISLKYLESIMNLLTKGKMLESVSGKGGGYRLVRQPNEYQIMDILQLIEGDLAPVTCLCGDGQSCERPVKCTTHSFWKGLDDVISHYLENNTLQDVVDEIKN